MREIITLQVGQCGNQIGHDFWMKLCHEHEINSGGYPVSDINLDDRKDIFFYQSDSGRSIPRAILVDLEPRVIDSIPRHFYNEENIFVSNDGCGAGNNWAHGYCSGAAMKEDIIDMMQRESEGCDYLESFFVLHSVAGGTGSGFGSLLLEEAKSNFPKKILKSFSIFPNNSEISDVVVQPYNSILALDRLYQNCDSVVVMDNCALGKVALDSLRVKLPNYDHINSLISTIICSSTNTLRFPTYMFADMTSIISASIPCNSLKFLIPSFSPFLSEKSKIVRKLSVDEVLRRLHTDKTRMATCDTKVTDSYIAVFNLLCNVSNIADVQKSLLKKSNLKFVPWVPQAPHTVMGRDLGGRVCGFSLANFTGIASLFRKICAQFDALKQRNAYVENYRKFCGDLAVFDQARESVQQIIENYQGSELMTFRNL